MSTKGLNKAYISSMNKQYNRNLENEKRNRNLSPSIFTKKLILSDEDLDEKEILKRNLLKKSVMTSRNDMMSSKLSLKKFVVHALRK